MPPKKQAPLTQQIASGTGNIQISGNNNVVKQSITQKISNFFITETEPAEHRIRRIMLGHVENFWVKGILEKSLHGAALLGLGIKENPGALQYPWAIKRESNKEVLPAGTSMLEIYLEIGMGRSLLILGAPGSGKTTMLLELTRQLIQRARGDITEPIPVVFNLSSWSEKFTFAEWLARELNVIYTIPKKLAPAWIQQNRMLLLLDGLDEVKQESRDHCVEAINRFRKENGLTSMIVCSRSLDYAELKTSLSFDGAIEIQPLSLAQAKEYFEHFGKQMKGMIQAFKEDSALREMAETPLFLSIMTLAYNNIQSKDIRVSTNLDVQREHLFNTYIDRMFERPERTKRERVNKLEVLHWLSWLARKMVEHNTVPFLIEDMQPNWLERKPWKWYELFLDISTTLTFAVFGGLFGRLLGESILQFIGSSQGSAGVMMLGTLFGAFTGLLLVLMEKFPDSEPPARQVGSGRFSIMKRLRQNSHLSEPVESFSFWEYLRRLSVWDYLPRPEEISVPLSLVLILGWLGGSVAWLIVWSYFWQLLRILKDPGIEVLMSLLMPLQVYRISFGILWGFFYGFQIALESWRKIKSRNGLFKGGFRRFQDNVRESIRKAENTIRSSVRTSIVRLRKIILAWDWEQARGWAAVGLQFGLLGGIGLALVIVLVGNLTSELHGWLNSLVIGLEVALICSGIGGLATGILSQGRTDKKTYTPVARKITLVESVRLSWRGKNLDHLSIFIIFAALLWPFVGLSYGLAIGLGLGVLSALFIEKRPIDQTTYPGQKIVFSIRSILFMYLLIGLAGGLFFILSTSFGSNLNADATRLLLLFVVMAICVVWIILGGSAVVRHYCLRFLLGMNHSIPWDMIPFLNHCVDLIFLRRVGGGYIFVHRLLMEHFAEMYGEHPRGIQVVGVEERHKG